MDKIAELVRRELATHLYRYFSSDFVAVSDVKVAKDLSVAKVWLRAVRNPEAVVRRAQELSGEITKQLAGSVKLKRVPKLFFYLDKSADHLDRIEELLEEIKRPE
ncbi:MAG: 30S ribosome-binding factor RbfA [Patescibacteria group bacterium]